MSSNSKSTTFNQDARVALDTGSVQEFLSPNAVKVSDSGQAYSLGDKAKLVQTMTSTYSGLQGEDLSTLFGQVFGAQAVGYEAVKGMADSAVKALADANKAVQTPDYQNWLPYVVVAVIGLSMVAASRRAKR